MKIIELNIGLSSKALGELNFVEVLNALTGRGFIILAYRVQSATCKDGEERCLAVKSECPADWQTQIATLSDKFGQDCIAVVGFIGHSPYDAFVPSLWVESVAPAEHRECELKNTLRRFYSHVAENSSEKDLIYRLAQSLKIDL